MDQDKDSLDLQSVNDDSVETVSVAKRSSISQASVSGIRNSISGIKQQVSKKISNIKRRNSSMESQPDVVPGLKTDDPFNEVGQGLRHIYHKVIEPIEKKCNFHQVQGVQQYDDAEFEAKPLVLLMGQYSTGKSTFIKYLIGEEYPDITIGAEPTTDRFVAVLKGPEKKVLQGHALVNLKNLPFRNLSMVRLKNQNLNSDIAKNDILNRLNQDQDQVYLFNAIFAWFPFHPKNYWCIQGCHFLISVWK